MAAFPPDLVEALQRVTLLLLEARRKTGGYTYETINVKRWVLGDGGHTGNCETCEDNAAMGWIPDDDVFFSTEGEPIDGPPAHPNDTCDLEYGEKRKRVY